MRNGNPESSHWSERVKLDSDSSDDGDHDEETADARRVRMAKAYLEDLEDKVASNDGAGIVGRKAAARARRGLSDDGPIPTSADNVAAALADQVAKAAPDYIRQLSKGIAGLIGKGAPRDVRTIPDIVARRTHKLSPTSVTVSEDGRVAVSGGKDASVILTDLETGVRTKWLGHRNGDVKAGHTADVLSVAMSIDGSLVASGGRDKYVRLWDVRSPTPLVASMKGHRAAVTGVAFRRGGTTLYSSSEDRTVKVWSAAEGAFQETLFGHLSEVNGISALSRERCFSVSRDGTARLWKVIEESQLLFDGAHVGSVDAVTAVADDTFVSGGQDGTVVMWNAGRRKPVGAQPKAHGSGWISALAGAPYSDIVASGSCNGVVRLWRVNRAGRTRADAFGPVASFALKGWVNGLAWAGHGRVLVAAVAPEHRLGRWSKLDGVRGGLRVIPLLSDSWEDDLAAQEAAGENGVDESGNGSDDESSDGGI